MRLGLIFVLSLFFTANAQAALKHYVAEIDESQWTITQSTPVQCRLEHYIPHYGKAIFTGLAGKDYDLSFSLDMWIKPEKETQAKLMSRAPKWRPGILSTHMTQLTYFKHFNGEVPKKMAWSMLFELDQGMQPTFYYEDWYNQANKIAVGLSAVNFQRRFKEFKSCLSSLLPYSFEDIAFTVLSYNAGGTELTRFSKAQIQKVQTYLTHDPSVELILIDAYTDSYGSNAVNNRVSNRRADSVKALFVASGIPTNRIHTQGHGEKRHVAANRTLDERAKNRRVVIRITKSL